ncbi:MAG: YidC/Oxa1 family membrane protein insertase [Clostridia bacterium]|nr:YidC/Oxa1 family membrane protein insertase [Clostridia bacterium]MBR3954971.1 YidC/Oxa1 family membrane protein insertase [Clostridia bacterium]
MQGLYSAIAVPFGIALYFLYGLTGEYLISLFILTFVVRLCMLPSSMKQQKNAAKQLRLQAKVNKIRAKYASLPQREAQAKIQQETQELYQREGFSAAAGGCMPLVVQMIVMMGLYGAIYSPLSQVLRIGEEHIAHFTEICNNLGLAMTNGRVELAIMGNFDKIIPELDPTVYGDMIERITTFIEKFTIFGIDLTAYPNTFNEEGGDWRLILIPVFSGVTAMLSSILMYLRQRKTNPEMAKNPSMGCMTFMSPLMSAYFSYTFSAGVGVYWIISNILTFFQTLILNQVYKPEKVIAMNMIDETVERRSKENSIKLRAKQIAEEQ